MADKPGLALDLDRLWRTFEFLNAPDDIRRNIATIEEFLAATEDVVKACAAPPWPGETREISKGRAALVTSGRKACRELRGLRGFLRKRLATLEGQAR